MTKAQLTKAMEECKGEIVKQHPPEQLANIMAEAVKNSGTQEEMLTASCGFVCGFAMEYCDTMLAGVLTRLLDITD